MSLEIEKKYRLTSNQYEYLLAELADVGANFKGEVFEENIIYGGGVLNNSGAVLRVRKVAGKTILTFKRRLQSASGIKQNVEHETLVEDGGQLEKIIADLGFEPVIVYEKRRKTWRFRSVEIVLDELPFGLFMEIEGSANAIIEAEMIIGAEDFETENETYPRLTANFGSRSGGVLEARFSESKGR